MNTPGINQAQHEVAQSLRDECARLHGIITDKDAEIARLTKIADAAEAFRDYRGAKEEDEKFDALRDALAGKGGGKNAKD